MNGRYALYAKLESIVARFNAGESSRGLWKWDGDYNVSPGQVVPVLAFDGRKHIKVVPMRWGLHPHWKKEAPEGRPLFNARAETAHEKASFRTPFRRRRALIPLNGWYEWEGETKPKTPYYIFDETDELTALVGLWDQWRVDEGITLISMTLLTTPAVGSIKHLHHRMPVRLPESQWTNWLDWDGDPHKTLSYKLGSDNLAYHAVDRAVGSGRAVGPSLIKPLDPDILNPHT